MAPAVADSYRGSIFENDIMMFADVKLAPETWKTTASDHAPTVETPSYEPASPPPSNYVAAPSSVTSRHPEPSPREADPDHRQLAEAAADSPPTVVPGDHVTRASPTLCEYRDKHAVYTPRNSSLLITSRVDDSKLGLPVHPADTPNSSRAYRHNCSATVRICSISCDADVACSTGRQQRECSSSPSRRHGHERPNSRTYTEREPFFSDAGLTASSRHNLNEGDQLTFISKPASQKLLELPVNYSFMATARQPGTSGRRPAQTRNVGSSLSARWENYTSISAAKRADSISRNIDGDHGPYRTWNSGLDLSFSDIVDDFVHIAEIGAHGAAPVRSSRHMSDCSASSFAALRWRSAPSFNRQAEQIPTPGTTNKPTVNKDVEPLRTMAGDPFENHNTRHTGAGNCAPPHNLRVLSGDHGR